MSQRLSGKKALVTGGAQGLGAAIAEQMAAEGAKVLVTDINMEALEQTAAALNAKFGAGTVFSLRHDVASESDWEAAVAHAQATMGGLSVLVNNAGVVTTATVEQIDLERWHRDFAINVDGVFLGIQKALPLMREAQPGSIINLSSIAALIASHNFASYNASKAAVWMLTKSVALHCARQRWDIRCNSVHPAFIRTPILNDLIGDKDEAHILGKLAAQVPLGRLGEAIDVAHAVVYLASDESRFMTGAEMKLDGGISAQ